MQVVFAHSPHRCSPSPGDRQLTLFVTGYSVFDVHKKILFFSQYTGENWHLNNHAHPNYF